MDLPDRPAQSGRPDHELPAGDNRFAVRVVNRGDLPERGVEPLNRHRGIPRDGGEIAAADRAAEHAPPVLLLLNLEPAPHVLRDVAQGVLIVVDHHLVGVAALRAPELHLVLIRGVRELQDVQLAVLLHLLEIPVRVEGPEILRPEILRGHDLRQLVGRVRHVLEPDQERLVHHVRHDGRNIDARQVPRSGRRAPASGHVFTRPERIHLALEFRLVHHAADVPEILVVRPAAHPRAEERPHRGQSAVLAADRLVQFVLAESVFAQVLPVEFFRPHSARNQKRGFRDPRGVRTARGRSRVSFLHRCFSVSSLRALAAVRRADRGLPLLRLVLFRLPLFRLAVLFGLALFRLAAVTFGLTLFRLLAVFGLGLLFLVPFRRLGVHRFERAERPLGQLVRVKRVVGEPLNEPVLLRLDIFRLIGGLGGAVQPLLDPGKGLPQKFRHNSCLLDLCRGAGLDLHGSSGVRPHCHNRYFAQTRLPDHFDRPGELAPVHGNGFTFLDKLDVAFADQVGVDRRLQLRPPLPEPEHLFRRLVDPQVQHPAAGGDPVRTVDNRLGLPDLLPLVVVPDNRQHLKRLETRNVEHDRHRPDALVEIAEPAVVRRVENNLRAGRYCSRGRHPAFRGRSGLCVSRRAGA